MITFFDQIVYGHMSTTRQKSSHEPSSITVSTVENIDIHKEVKNLVLLDPAHEQSTFDGYLVHDLFTMVCPLTGEKQQMECWDEDDEANILFGWVGFKDFVFEIHESEIRFFYPENHRGDIEVGRKDLKDSSRFFFVRGRVYDNQTLPYRFNADITIRRYIKTNLDFKEAVQDFLIHFYMEYMRAAHMAVFKRLIHSRFKHWPKEEAEDLPF